MIRFLYVLLLGLSVFQASAETLSLNSGWMFMGEVSGAEAGAAAPEWVPVTLPHTANVEPLTVNDPWMGICWYRRTLNITEEQAAGKVFLEFEGAMTHAQVWINGKKAADHHGGYLPVFIDATDFVQAGKNRIAVRLDNTDNPITGPKPHFRTDFCKYGGLYRNATVTFKDKVYISHPLQGTKKKSGGIFITMPIVSEKESTVQVKVDVRNATKDTELRLLIKDPSGKTVAEKLLSYFKFPVSGFQFHISSPRLWSPDAPNLYELKAEVVVDGRVVDVQTERFGIRKFEFKNNELYINGKKTFLRGVNRHQEYPFIGYALSDEAQVRDARWIKAGGFDLIRLSHYPQSPAFMDACDELGIVVLDAILGWQYYSEDKAFREYCFESARNLVRRDRNHPCVLAWEVSLNETRMPEEFMQKLHSIVHKEYPGENVYTCGWLPGIYDIYMQARQHRIGHGTEHVGGKPYFVSEYGDWEYFSSNAGLNQNKLDKTRRRETSSRQMRGYGEARLMQQAFNVQEAHNDNLAGTPAFGDAYWCMFDYNSGCHPELVTCGLMDIFRLPKSAYRFYQSQRDPADGAVLHISNHWKNDSPLDVKIFSNCDEVELFVNGVSKGRKSPNTDSISTALAQPPFTFNLPSFEAGELKAVGFIEGKPVAEQTVRTPGKAVALKVWIDDAGVAPVSNDVVFLRIAAVDENGTVVPSFLAPVAVSVNGDAVVLNNEDIKAEAGIATALVRVGSGRIDFSATADGLEGSCGLRIKANRRMEK